MTVLVIKQTNASFLRKCSLTFQSKNELASLNFKAYLILPLNECYSEFCCGFALQPMRNQFSWLVQELISLNNVAVSMRLKCSVNGHQIPVVQRTHYLRAVYIQVWETKTKLITLANHNRFKQPNEPITTRSKYM